MSHELSWLIAGLLLLIIELFTTTFFLMWVAAAAFLAAGAAYLTDPIWVEWAVFTVTGVILLILTRPLARSIHGSVTLPSNVDRLIGEKAYVLQKIDNDRNTGRVRIESDEWRARSTGEIIAEDEYVLVKRVEGTTLIVAPLDNTQDTDSAESFGPDTEPREQ
jgi:membrane protein implicated in regulation of membrane protease activity